MKLAGRLPILPLFLAALFAGGTVYAQLEGADRGIPPIDSASTFEVTGVQVDVVGPNAEKAREAGWREAQQKGWKALWAKTNNRPLSEAPALTDAALNAMVSAIVVEEEQIGPTRYIATLGVLFDRARTGQILGVGGIVRRSAPMLVIPVMQTGGAFQSFESRNPWQAAWARFRTGNSAIDYVRPTGSGIDPLLLNVSQTGRPGRGWWRMLLDQYGAADVVMPEVRLQRLWPGGPAIGTFIARHGPDNRVLGQFRLRVENSAAIPKLLDEGVRRLDALYAQALAAGELHTDPTLAMPEAAPVEDLIEEAAPATATAAPAPSTAAPLAPMPGAASVTAVTVQVATPDAGAVSRAELAVSRVPGVSSAITTALAVGGTSTMKVRYSGDPAALAAALQAQGWSVSGSGTSLRISRGGG
ncbi:MAG TPA: heavy-metal-associated domain-containing protein, partial [Allosphingosinicella sp.]|nr:heavy-metal-associated domain-containing protein [Allosphingosinicella sp.]